MITNIYYEYIQEIDKVELNDGKCIVNFKSFKSDNIITLKGCIFLQNGDLILDFVLDKPTCNAHYLDLHTRSVTKNSPIRGKFYKMSRLDNPGLSFLWPANPPVHYLAVSYSYETPELETKWKKFGF